MLFAHLLNSKYINELIKSKKNNDINVLNP